VHADQAVSIAYQAFQQQNVPLAAGICENVLETGYRPLGALTLLGTIAMEVGQYWRAADLFREASWLAPADPSLQQKLDQAQRQADPPPSHLDGNRCLLIKPWGCGFCADLDHVLGALLLAELTVRTPIIHWGEGSLFRDDTDDNAWPAFFDPVSGFTINDLTKPGLRFFPENWNAQNLNHPNPRRMPIGPQVYLNRPEEVAVSDMHFGVIDLVPWIRPDSALSGKNIHQIYRALFDKHIRLNASIRAAVDRFAADHFTAPMIAAHIRGSDKITEDPELALCIPDVEAEAASLLEANPTARLFLLTDDENIRARLAARCGPRVITTDAVRSSSQEGIHLQTQPSRKRLGTDVLTDMYLAARCDLFIGIGSSNVSAMIPNLKDWPPGACRLLGQSLLHKRNLMRYLPGLPYEKAQALHAELTNLEVPGAA
jgi:hypothetical protein